MSDYGEICIALTSTIRDAYELATQGNMKEALHEAKFLSALADQLVESLKQKQQGESPAQAMGESWQLKDKNEFRVA